MKTLPVKKYGMPVLTLLVLLVSIFVEIIVKNSIKQPPVARDYYLYFLLIFLSAYILSFTIFFKNQTKLAKLIDKSLFISGFFIGLLLLNALTSKFALLPVLYFPSFSRVLGVFVLDRKILLECVISSAKLLAIGVVGGTLVGLITGIGIGFSKRVNYWLGPLLRVLGPIPSTAWVPLALVIFPSALQASAFLIGLAVWFPVTLMTSSGIFNISQSYFEAGATLGANQFDKIFKIGIPAAMPHIFLGLFNGTCASFITLITAEMVGAKRGIGWYINWQKEMLSYANVYAGLLLIAVLFSLLITLLFKGRDHLLGWQKGMVKW